MVSRDEVQTDAFGIYFHELFKGCDKKSKNLEILVKGLKPDSESNHDALVPACLDAQPTEGYHSQRLRDESRFQYMEFLYLHVVNFNYEEDSEDNALTPDEFKALVYSEVPLVVAELATESWSNSIVVCPESKVPDYRDKYARDIVIWRSTCEEVEHADEFSYIFIPKDLILEDIPSSNTTLRSEEETVSDIIDRIHVHLLELGDQYVGHLDLAQNTEEGYLLLILLLLWLYSCHQVWPMSILSRMKMSPIKLQQLRKAILEVGRECFATYAVQRFLYDLRNIPKVSRPKQDAISSKWRQATLNCFTLWSSSCTSLFVKKASESIGNLMHGVTVSSQQIFCLDQHFNNGIHQVQFLAMHSMCALGVICKILTINSSEVARKFVSQPETVIVTGRALIYAVDSESEGNFTMGASWIGHLEVLLIRFLEAVYFLVSEPESKRNIKLCERFTRHVEASWLFIQEQLESIIPDDPDMIIRQRMAVEIWTSLRNRIHMYMRGHFNEHPDMSKFYALASMTSYCNYQCGHVIRSVSVKDVGQCTTAVHTARNLTGVNTDKHAVLDNTLDTSLYGIGKCQ
ncbi:hypothetical protein C8Q75DRAFT_736035 [Abortiporus biennis]|nr:hypothetical protein C8Q75DRAFT_736035 [Abortiporus biennis]